MQERYLNIISKQKMTMYKNLGAILYITDTPSCEIYETQTYWLFQLNLIMPNPQQYLTALVNIYNEKIFYHPVLQLYSESNSVTKFNAILLPKDKAQLSQKQIVEEKQISQLCNKLYTFIEVYQKVHEGFPNNNMISSIDYTISNSLFINCKILRNTNKLFYLYFPSISLIQDQKTPRKSQRTQFQTLSPIKKYLMVLREKINSHQIKSYDYQSKNIECRLISKLLESDTILKFKEELTYFQDIYVQSANIGHQSHRKYHRKHSSTDKNKYQINLSTKNNLGMRNSKSKAVHQQQYPKSKTLHLINSRQSFHKTQNKSTRRKTTSNHTSQVKMKIKLRNESIKQNLSQTGKGQSENKQNKLKKLWINSGYFNKTGTSELYQSSTSSLYCPFVTKKQQNYSYTVNLADPQNKHKQKLKEIMKKKDSKKYIDDKQQVESSKRKNIKIKKQSLNWKNHACINTLIDDLGDNQTEKHTKELQSLESHSQAPSMADNKQQPIKSEAKATSEIANQLSNTQKIDSLSNELKKESLSKIDQLSNIQRIDQVSNIQKKDQLSNGTKQQKKQQRIITIGSSHKQQKMDEIQTIDLSKPKQRLPSSKICEQKEQVPKLVDPQYQLLIEDTKNKINKLDYIGYAVTNTRQYISTIQGQTFFWHLPAFLLYKDFYMKRCSVIENLKLKIKKLNKDQLLDLSQFDIQNQQCKKSLVSLLKSTTKKCKKFITNKKQLENITQFINLDYTIPNSQQFLCATIEKYIKQLFRLIEKQSDNKKSQYKALIGYAIQMIDAYLICRNYQFNMKQRQKINPQLYNSDQVIKYFQKRRQDYQKVIRNPQ